MPFLMVLSRLCEEYGGYPAEALWHLEHDPDQLALRILPLRAYVRAKAEYDRAEDQAGFEAAVKRNPMVLEVRNIEHAIAAEKWRAKKAAAIKAAEEADI